MFALTKQEKEAIIFLGTVALLGAGINLCIKINSQVKRIVVADINLAKINLNKVSSDDLLHCRGISPNLAKKIIEFRDINGPFNQIEELKNVKGIGDYRFEKLKSLFFIE